MLPTVEYFVAQNNDAYFFVVDSPDKFSVNHIISLPRFPFQSVIFPQMFPCLRPFPLHSIDCICEWITMPVDVYFNKLN